MPVGSMWSRSARSARGGLLPGLALLGLLALSSAGCQEGANPGDRGPSAPLLYEFPEGTRYFPKYMLQFGDPIFFWDDFKEYRSAHWGDNSNGSIRVADDRLDLEPGKQVWLLYRLGYGTVEFRETTWGARPGATQDKIIGFGDPAEGEFVGFRLDRTSGELIAEIRHHGQISDKVIPWRADYEQPAGYRVHWSENTARFFIMTPIRSEEVAQIDGSIVPDIRLEIIVWNQAGTGNVQIGLVKYDKRP